MEKRRMVRRRLLAAEPAAAVLLSMLVLSRDLESNGGSLSASMAPEVFCAKNSSYGSELLHDRDSFGVPGTAHADTRGIYGRELARKNSEVVSRGCEKKLRIAAPHKPGFKAFFVNITHPNTERKKVTGYNIEIFEEGMKRLQPRPDLSVHYPFGADSCLDLRNNVSLRVFDSAFGDVKPRPDYEGNWIFLNPLTKELWLATVCFVFFTGFVFWMIERSINPEFQGSSLTQFSTALYFVLSTLTFSHGQILRSPLSKIVLVVWCLVVLVLVQSYVANLSSMLAAEASANKCSSSVAGSAPLTLRSFSGLFVVTGCISALMLLISLTRSAYAAYTSRVRGSESQSTPQNDEENVSVVVPEQPVQEVRDNDYSQDAHVSSAISRDQEAGGAMQDSMSNASEPAPDVYVQIEMTSTSNGVGGGSVDSNPKLDISFLFFCK